MPTTSDASSSTLVSDSSELYVLDGSFQFIIKHEAVETHVRMQVNMHLMRKAFPEFESGESTSWLGSIQVEDQKEADAFKILVDMVHQRDLPIDTTVEQMVCLARLATVGETRLHWTQSTVVQDYFVDFIDPEEPGYYIRGSAEYMQYLFAAKKLMLSHDVDTFPPPFIWYDLLSRIQLDDENKIVTRRGIRMFLDGVSPRFTAHLLRCRRMAIHTIIDEGRKFILRNEANRHAVIAAHVNISAILGKGFKNFDENPTDTDLDRKALVDVEHELAEHCQQTPGPTGAIFRYLKDEIFPKIMACEGMKEDDEDLLTFGMLH